MSDEKVSEKKSKTKNEGAYKGGDGNYFFDLNKLQEIDVGSDYAPTYGPVVEGERVQVGLIHMPADGGADPHIHPNEQFFYIVQGTFWISVGEKEKTLNKGELIYVPPNVEHEEKVIGDQDVIFFTVKDLTHGIHGTPKQKTD